MLVLFTFLFSFLPHVPVMAEVENNTKANEKTLVKNESEAAAVVSYRQRRLARQKMLTAKKSGENLSEEMTKTLIPLILKTDVDGSIDVSDE